MNFYLSNLQTKEDLLEIVCRRWGFEYSNLSIPFTISTQSVIQSEIIGKFYNFFVFYFVLNDPLSSSFYSIERFLLSQERGIVSQIPEEYRRTSIFIFSNQNGEFWHFVVAEGSGKKIKLKRFAITPENRNKLRTACEQLDYFKINPSEDKSTESIVRKKEIAFSVEEVTDKFFKEYRKIFDWVKNYLQGKYNNIPNSQEKAHRYTHLLFNRLMFLYFVQKRGCFGNDKEFLSHFWNAYRDNFEGKNLFHQDWLNVLFFESLNGKFYAKEYFKLGNSYPDFNSILSQTPFLNGGLFKEDSELDFLGYQIPDSYFIEIFNFLESYNFTVEENTPFEQEIAINPEILGFIYEMLVNVSEKRDERHQLGIFYTPKVEIEFMIRNSLVEYLFNKTKIDKKILYEFIFAEKGEQKIPQFNESEREKLLKELDEITILDPACGSGHFLVVALDILFELKEILYQRAGKTYDRFEEKKKIIEKSIFGVDVKGWAVEIAKLRLWLNLFLEASEQQLKNRFEPLLPSLSFKLRVGDSLVQSIGDLIPLREFKVPDRSITNRIKELRNHKVLVYQNRYDTKKVLEEEKNLIKEIITCKKYKLSQEIQNLNIEIKNLKEEKFPEEQKLWDLPSEKKTDILEEIINKKNEEIQRRQNELKELENFNIFFERTVQDKKEPPLIWDIGFAEVFEEKDGFDIVIANPPYVRQELISDPTKPENQSIEEKREYKEKLLKQIQLDWNDEKGDLIKLDKKCDLYVYFYLKGLKLLNSDGVMCFISSNSWLDVDFGKGLQEVLLKRVPIVAIYDNQAKRSFKHADINTIIILLKAPFEKNWQNNLKENIVKFVVFKKPFEEIIFSETFLEIENTKGREEKEGLKIFPIKQIELWKDGAEIPKKEGEALEEKFDEKSIYIGNKWGGKYLRAPEIYWKILEKGKDKLVKLGDIAEVKFGIKTGANEFFYLEPTGKPAPKGLLHVKNSAGWEGYIEEEFLKPVIKSPRELKTIIVKEEDLRYKVFMCHKSKEELKGTYALEYIDWGEKQGYQKRPSCKGRERWWDLGEWEISKNILPMFEDKRVYCFYNDCNAYIDAALYWVYTKTNEINLNILLNSSLLKLWKELLCRPPEGLGVMQMKVYHYHEMPIPIEFLNFDFTSELLEFYKSFIDRKILSIFEELGFKKCEQRNFNHPEHPYEYVKPEEVSFDRIIPDRRELDKIVFEALGLTEEEQLEVYRAVLELVKNRLLKARSV